MVCKLGDCIGLGSSISVLHVLLVSRAQVEGLYHIILYLAYMMKMMKIMMVMMMMMKFEPAHDSLLVHSFITDH